MATRAQYCVAVKPKSIEDTWDDWENTGLGNALYDMGRKAPRIETTGGVTYLSVISRYDWTPLLPADLKDDRGSKDWKYISRELGDLLAERDVRDLWYVSEDVYRFGDITLRKHLVTRPKLADRDRAA